MITNKRKIAITVLSLVLVLTLTIGATLAFMTKETEKRVNNFTFANSDEALNAMLTEPKWDGVIGYEYTDTGIVPIYAYVDDDNNPTTAPKKVYGYTDGDKSKPIYDITNTSGTKPTMDSNDPTFKPVYGEDMAKDMIPGQTAEKNPFITNTGYMTDEWVAAKVTFVYKTTANGHDAGKQLTQVDMNKVLDVVDIYWNVGTNDDEWDRVIGLATNPSQTFYYRSLLSKGADETAVGVYGDATEPIFTTIKVKEGASNTQVKLLEDMGGFTIYVEGFAAQKEVGGAGTSIYDKFKAWGYGTDNTAGTTDDNVIFTNTPSLTSAVDISKSIIPKS